jgi:hypothetical protein
MDVLPTAVIVATWLLVVFILFVPIAMRTRASLSAGERITAHETAIALLVAAMLSASAIALAYLLLANR